MNLRHIWLTSQIEANFINLVSDKSSMFMLHYNYLEIENCHN